MVIFISTEKRSYFRLGLVPTREFSANSFGLLLLSVKGHLAGKERATFTTSMLLEIENVFTERGKTHTAGIPIPKNSSSAGSLVSKN